MSSNVPERPVPDLGQALDAARAAVAENDALDVDRCSIGAVMYSRALLRRALVDLLDAVAGPSLDLDDRGPK